MNDKRIVITVDGLAGSGKTALSKALAKKLDYKYLSSGLFYRALGYVALNQQIDYQDVNALVQLLKDSQISIKLTGDYNNRVFLNAEDITDKVYPPEVSEATSQCSAHQAVRKELLTLQRSTFAGNNLIAEGRDLGTIVFPDADCKIFLECSPEILAQRRLEQMTKDKQFSENELAKLKAKLKIEVEERNKRDQNRDISPTIPAEDAIIIDNSAKTLTELLDFVYLHVSERLNLRA